MTALPKMKNLRLDHINIQSVWFTLLVDFTDNDKVYYIQPGHERSIKKFYSDFKYLAENFQIDNLTLPDSVGKITKIEGVKYKAV